MGRSQQNVGVLLVGVLVLVQALVFSSSPAAAQLDPDFYNTSCPNLLSVMSDLVAEAIQNEARIPASLLRLHFHDCFVGGCDASILLDAPADNLSDTEKTSGPNNNSARGYEAVDTIKAGVESACPGVVSCADILTLAALFSVVQTGGPNWTVPLGRRDSLTTKLEFTGNLISPDLLLPGVKEKYAAQNFSNVGVVALSGAHTIGLVRCAVLQQRLYNFTASDPSSNSTSDPSINATLLAQMEELCPNTTDFTALQVTQGLDLQTNQTFDNFYFQNLLLNNGKLTSDEQMFVSENGTDDTAVLVQQYADDQDLFFSDFATSMIQMGNLNLTTGTDGEVRLNCRVPNSANIQEVVDTAVHEDSAMARVFKKAVEKVVEEMDAVATIGEELERLVEETVDSALHPSA